MARALVAAGVAARIAGTMVEVEAPDGSACDTVRDLTVELGLGLVRMQERHHHIEDVFRNEEAGRVQPV
jgi:ABC-2 type transport system ATP-binding protein